MAATDTLPTFKSATFDTLARIISTRVYRHNTDGNIDPHHKVPINAIYPDSHFVNDLGGNDLNFMEVTFEVEKTFGIKVPAGEWSLKARKEGSTERYLRMDWLSHNIDELVAQKGSSS